MIGFVIVSHSATLANAAVDLAMQMIHGEPPPVRIASGADSGFGTDAAAIADAIDALAGEADGVVVVTDLGSAVLSSELAIDLRSSTVPVRISEGPFVEGITAGLVRAATGGDLDDVVAEVDTALAAKRRNVPDADPGADTDTDTDTDPGAGEADGDREVRVPVGSDESHGAEDANGKEPAVSARATLRNPMGLHSRPAALVVKAVGAFDADVTVANATTGAGPASAASMVALLALGATEGDVLVIRAMGADAADAVETVRQLVIDGFGEAEPRA